MTVIAVAFVSIGFRFVFWARRDRDRHLAWYDRRARWLAPAARGAMMARGYVLSFRIGGLVAIAAGLLMAAFLADQVGLMTLDWVHH